MNRQNIFEVVKQKIVYVREDIDVQDVVITSSLQNIGADSMDRAEIIQLTAQELKLNIPMVEFGKATNIEDIVDVLFRHL